MSAKLYLLLLLLLSALAALSEAFIVPNGIKDGLYMHTLNGDGTHTHTALEIAGTKSETHLLDQNTGSRKRDLPLPHTTTTCGDGNGVMNTLRKSHFAPALKKFNDGCNETLDLGREPNDYYAVYGSAIIFMCNYGGRWCKRDEAWTSFGMIKEKCGGSEYGINTGWVRIWRWGKSYGYDMSDNDICR